MTETDELGLPAHAFDKQDAGGDLNFYAPARLVTHIDKAAVEALSAFYRATLPAGARILDLMSSWVSHLPIYVAYLALLRAGLDGDRDAVRDAAVAAGFLGQAAVQRHRPLVDRMIGVILGELNRAGPFDFGDRAFVGTLREEGAAMAADRATWHVRRSIPCSRSVRSAAPPCSRPD